MSKPLEILLAAVIGVELIGGCYWLYQRAADPRPPAVDLSLVDELTAQDIKDRSASCRTAKDWRLLARTLFATGYFAEGEACFHQAAALEPQNADLVFDWGFLQSQMGRLDESNEHFQQALDLKYAKPDDCRYFLGRNYLRQEKPDKAAEAFTQGKELFANQYELARILFRQGKHGEALTMLEPVLEFYPRKLEPNILRHHLEEALGHMDLADEYREKGDLAEGRLPTPFDVEWGKLEEVRQGMSYFRRYREAHKLVDNDKLEEAAALYRQLLELKWEALAPEHLHLVESRLNRTDKAVELLQEILKRQGPSSAYLDLLGVTLNEANQPAKAREAWERAFRLHSQEDLTDICFHLANSYRKANNKEKSKYYLAQFNLSLGLQKFRVFELDEAGRRLQVAVQVDPNLARAWFYLGEVRRRRGQKRAAQVAYTRCLQLEPTNSRAQQGLERLKLRRRR